MSSRRAAAVRTAVVGFALSVGALFALGAVGARAEATAPETNPQAACAEGRALLAAGLAYLEARVAPAADQQSAWRTFADSVRVSAGDLDRVCVDESSSPKPADAGDRLERIERHAAAMQAMFGAMAKAYRTTAPVLTAAQRDILSRNIVPLPPSAGPFAPPPGVFALPAGIRAMAQGFGEIGANSLGMAVPWGRPPF